MVVNMDFLPDGISGDWSIDTITVPEKDLSQIVAKIQTGRYVPVGQYKRLMRNGTVVMSNTPDEIRDFWHFVIMAKGNILINGLGLGCVITKLLSKPDVTKITVIEASEDVIKLVAPHFNDSRLTIIHADAFTYNPPKSERYDYVWHDIWDYICSDNLKEMARLHRKYARRAGWQDSWAKLECQRQKRRNW